MQLVLLMIPAAFRLPAAPGERAQAWPAAVHTEHPRHSKCAVHSHPTSISVTRTARFFVSSPAVAMPNELWAGAEAGGAPDGVADDVNMDADRTEPQDRLRVREASDHSGAASAAGEVQRTCQADQMVGVMAATTGAVSKC